MADRMLNIGYIGNGKGTNRYHAPFALDRPNKFRIKTIYARHISHEAWPAIPGTEYVTDIDALLGDPQIDIVEVCTPSSTHFQMAKLALEAGKHVVVDKPFTVTEAEARELFDLAAARGVTVQCYQNRRFDSDFVTAKDVLESGRLGRVHEIVTSYDYFRPTMMQDSGLDPVNNAAYGHASHCVDQVISWFGMPDRVHSELRQLSGEGTANDYYDFDFYYDSPDPALSGAGFMPGGLKVSIHANYNMAFQRPSFELYGDAGAYLKYEKDSQERDLKHFYLPAGHDDFGLDTPGQYGTLRWYDEDGFHEERVVSARTSYSQYYDALYQTVANGAPQLVRPEETLRQIGIFEAASKELR